MQTRFNKVLPVIHMIAFIIVLWFSKEISNLFGVSRVVFCLFSGVVYICSIYILFKRDIKERKSDNL